MLNGLMVVVRPGFFWVGLRVARPCAKRQEPENCCGTNDVFHQSTHFLDRPASPPRGTDFPQINPDVLLAV
jgi:hypothetical protein